MEGKVISVIGENTIAIMVENKIKHPLYGKVIKRGKKYLAHVPTGAKLPSVNDVVEVQSSKPISKKKKWILK